MHLLAFVAFLFFVAVHAQAALPQFVAGQAVVERRGRAAAPVTDAICTDTDATKNKLYCNDADKCIATQVLKCNGKGGKTVPPVTFDCAGTSTPFCEDSEAKGEAYCTSVRPESCTPPPSTFVCNGAGLFPDPKNCKIYYNCGLDANFDYKPQLFKCPNQYVFDPSQTGDTSCRLTNNAYCTTVTCAATNVNVVMSYQYFPKSLGQYVYRCKTGGEIDIFRCDANFEADLNTYPVKCKPICTGANKLPYSGDTTKYWDCAYTGTKWEGQVWDCVAGKAFNPKTKVCEVIVKP